jgi:hypothetical protein
MTRKESGWALAVGITLTGVLAAAMLDYYPILDPSQMEGRLGEDHHNFFVRMVSAEFLFRAYGLSELIWFTPAMCGGGFQFANPIDVTYALPQLLSMLSNPILAVYLTHILMTFVGGLGAFILMRSTPFRMSLWPALAAATLFAMNGFFMARMVTGHLNFHTFMLIPLIAWCLIQAIPSIKRRSARTTFLSIIAGMLAALMVIGGGAHLIVPTAIAVFLVLMVANRLSATHTIPNLSVAVAIACITALCLSAAKLSAAYALTSNFPRTLYDLQGVVSLGEAVWLPLRSLFWNSHIPLETSGQWPLGSHEFEYSLSPFILIGLVPALVYSWRRNHRRLMLSVIFGSPIVLLVVFVNYYQPEWHAVLKQVPIVSSSLTLFRWYASFILVLCLIAGIGLQQLPSRWTKAASLLVIIGATSWQLMSYQDWKALNVIRYGPLVTGLEVSRSNGIQPINRLTVNTNQSGEPTFIRTTSYVEFTDGASQVFCYEPILGYAVEKLKIDNLRIGPVTTIIGDELNMKNPSCYLFPEENHCRPGDNFSVQQAKQLYFFTHYQPWAFELPVYQKIANKLSLVSWIGLLLLGLALTLRRLTSR